MSTVGFSVLGPLRVTVDGRPVPTGPAKRRALLALLVLRQNQVVALSAVTEELWHDSPPRSTAANLRSYLAGIRGMLPTDERSRVVLRPQGYLLRARADEVDATRFVALATGGQGALTAGEFRDAADTLAEALALWRGAVAEDAPAGAASASHRAALTEQRLVAREDLLEARLALGETSGLLTQLRELVATEPLRERGWVLLMTALDRAGDHGAALTAYDQARHAIVETLGIEPGPGLREQRRRILDGARPERPTGGTVGAAVEVAGPRWAPVWQLPLDVGGFTGRTRELGRLDALGGLAADRPSERPGTVVVISGMAGVGKTALAVRWARRQGDRTPDGQLYLDLRGYGTGRPLSPAAALGALLRSLGLPSDAIPPGQEERAALWRSTLHGRRVLVLLDNARDDDQVRPLLPASGLTLVTSRGQLRGLVAREGCQRLILRRLAADEAEALLATAVGAARTADRAALTALAERCAGLPLALRIVAERATRQPERGLGELTAELRAQRHRLDSFSLHGGAGTDVRAVLSWSYRALDAPTARLFRLLSLHPGDEFDVDGAAALAGLPMERAAPLLDHLVAGHLVLERRAGRCAFHDLVGLYAAERARQEEQPADRTAALARLLDWYVRTADQADRWLNTKRSRTVLPAVTGGPAGGPARTFGGYDAALDWFRTEYRTVLAAVDSAPDHGLDTQCWQLAWTMWTFLRLGQPATTWIELYDRALGAARRTGDRAGTAASLTVLGIVHSALGAYDGAIGRFQQALRLNAELGDLPAQARVLDNLGNACLHAGRLEEGLEYQHRGLRIHQAVRSPSEALALAHNNIAMTYVWLDRHDEAVSFAEKAVAMSRDGDHEQTLALALDSLGDAYRSGGGNPPPRWRATGKRSRSTTGSATSVPKPSTGPTSVPHSATPVTPTGPPTPGGTPWRRGSGCAIRMPTRSAACSRTSTPRDEAGYTAHRGMCGECAGGATRTVSLRLVVSQVGAAAASKMDFAVLGPLRVAVEGHAVPAGPAKQRSLLTLLLLRANELVPLQVVTEELWDQAPPRSTLANLRTYLAGIRGLLPGDERDRVVVGPHGYQLQVGVDELDVARFMARARQGQAALAAGRYREAVDRLAAARELWRGEVAEDVPAGAVTAPRRAALVEQRLVVWEDLLEARIALGDTGGLRPQLRELVAADPVRERGWVLLMTALYRAGDPAAALRAYAHARTAMIESVGIEPGPELRRLQRLILDGAELPGPDGRAENTAGARSTPSRAPIRQLPLDVGGFAGRSRELGALTTLADERPDSVLVISGMAGVGKTALAVHWAHRYRHDTPDGQIYLDLRGYGTGRPLTSTAALGSLLRSVGVAPDRVPPDLDGRASLWRSTLHDRRVLVLLDNARDEDQVRPLLPATGHTLVTSRNQLRGLVAREGARRLTVERLSPTDAAQLLTTALGDDRAADPTTVAELVERCGGLPLALRIVAERAARQPDRPLAELAAELRDQRGGLDPLSLNEGATTDVRAVPSWSC